ncbi:IS110 family transposase [Pseudonocardia sp. NPDC049154]|uniref:IS110 family transposase n=1 Tax=Pseudonocardia sp. NPDC049154 TaxID=3155501 RepID=UPI00340D5481
MDRKATGVSLVGAEFFVGIDWAAKTHAVCVLDSTGRQRAGFAVEHTAAGFTGLIRRLGRLGEPGGVPVAIERPDGRLVDALLVAGHPVVPVKPNAIKTWREGEVISGAKSDPGDAYVIAEYLRLRAHRLRAATPLTEDTTALRLVSRTRTDLVGARVAAGNQLAALLEHAWPGAKEIFADVTSAISLAFLHRYPTPGHAAHLGEKRMAAFCIKHGYSGRRTPAELLARLPGAPAGVSGPTVTDALRDAVLALITVLGALNAAIKDLDRSNTAHLHAHPDGAVFTSFPRAGQVNAAQIRAELAEPDAYTGPDAIAALAGLVPVTRASGKHRSVGFRWACNKRLRVALTTFADNSRHQSPWAAEVYRRAIASGKDHPHAIRILARAWVRIIWRCWNDGQPYDPTRHGGAARQLPPPAAA